MTPAQIIGSLNALQRGELDAIRFTLNEARLACKFTGFPFVNYK